MSENEKTFEAALSELEQLIREVESGSLPLETMIDRIDRGAKLIKFCQNKLNVMNGKVELLFKDDGEAGTFTEFDSSSDRTQAAVQSAPEKSQSTRKTVPGAAALPQEELPF